MPESVLLEHSRLRAWIEPDRLLPGAYQLIVDGTPQSHVNTLDPTDLTYEYVRRMAHVIDLMRPPGLALTAVHLGAGALTLPRYVEATRPGSRQQVIELEERLVELVRQSLPWHPASIRVRYGDARATLGRLPAGLRGTADLVVVDVFRGARTPAHVTSREFYAEVKTLLAQGGVVLVNVADGPPLRFARAQAATVQSVFTAACALAENSVLKGRRFGNIVIAASDAALPLAGLPRLLASGAYPAKAVVGAEFARFAAAPVTTDSNAVPSPEPGHLFGG
ncbi:MAG TPA: fused MFS/spermidine synthase [Microbacteriaceae bacterium]|nr:fused MFS/spermidine synthase [Microbacteriaceae bacterium]